MVYISFKKGLIPILVIILIVLSFFFINSKWWFPQGNVNFINLSIISFFIILFEIFAVIFIFFYQKGSIKEMKKHFIINALIEKNYIVLLIQFPLVIIFEELVFRLFIFTIILNFFGYISAGIISSLIFGIYHIHIWFEFKDKKIMFSFVLISTNLGLILGTCLVFFGIITCVFIHYFMVLSLFYFIKIQISN